MKRSLFRVVSNAARRALESAHYMRKWLRTPGEERAGLPPPRVWKMPLCWVRGCDYGPSICIEPWSLQFCACCAQEIGFLTSWGSIRPRTAEEVEVWGYDFGGDVDA